MNKTGLLVLAIIIVFSDSVRAQDGLMERGHAVYDKWCLPCHGDDPLNPGTIALGAKYKGRLPAVLAQRTDLTAEGIEQAVRHGISIMPFFRKTEIDDEELRAMIFYLTRKRRE